MEAAKDLWADQGFECTDIDNLQFAKTNEDGTFTFKEFKRFEHPELFIAIRDNFIHKRIDCQERWWITETIDLTNYTYQHIMNHVTTYGYIPALDGTWMDCTGNEVEPAIIAECIFEQESGQY